jgi:hypothetical protein
MLCCDEAVGTAEMLAKCCTRRQVRAVLFGFAEFCQQHLIQVTQHEK